MASEKQESVTLPWYDTVRDYTQRLVRIRGISPDGAGENAVAREVLTILREGGLADAYTACGLDPIAADPHARHNAYAFLRGQSEQTIVLLGHIDTVATGDYGPLEPWALDPAALADRQGELVRLVPDLAADLAAHPDDWMFGRGAVDMKSGVAVNIAVMRHLARLAHEGHLPLSVVLLATPDEENESSGVLQAVRFLLRLREQHDLTYLGAINTDYTTPLYPDDPHHYIYTGTVGKLLPSFLIVGREAHVGEPFAGVDANLIMAELIRDLSMDDTFCDSAGGQLTAPPVTLHATDLKAHYDVQLPFMAHFYLNVLTFTTTPGGLLERLRRCSEAALARVLLRLDERERRWLRATDNGARAERLIPRDGAVWTYATLYARAIGQAGEQQVAAALADEWNRWPATLDKRERSLHLTRRLWALSGAQGPAVVLYYAPPYYPHVAAMPCALHTAVADLAAAHPELRLRLREYFDFLCDLSYLRLDPGTDLVPLTANMPVWRDADSTTQPGAYTLPLEEIRMLDMPVVNLGVYGKGAHQRGERVLMSYSFGTLPQLVLETIERLAIRV